MCILGIDPENFNPRIFYVLKRKFDGTSPTKYHAHDFVSLIYILSGACTYTVNDVKYEVKTGDMVVCNPGVFHGRTINDDEEVVEFHVGFSNLSLESLPKNHLLPLDAAPIIRLAKYEQDIYRCCAEILLEQEKHEPGCELILKALVMKLIVLFLKAVRAEESIQTDGMFNFETYDKINIVNTIVAFINENYMKEIPLDKISKNMYLSPVYISKVFKEEVGDSPINYLIKTRLSKARELLNEGGASVKTAAKSVGYEDAYHFSKLFKKYYGYPPSRMKTPGGLEVRGEGLETGE